MSWKCGWQPRASAKDTPQHHVSLPPRWSTLSGAMWPLVEIDAPRDVGVGDLEMHVDRALMVASTTVEQF